MKKQILLLGLVCFLFAGIQFASAQSKQQNQTIAVQSTNGTVKENAEKVIAIFERTDKLKDSQKQKIYQVFEAVQEKKQNIAAIQDEKEKQLKTEKLQNFINTKLQDIFTNAQYKTYLQAMSR